MSPHATSVPNPPSSPLPGEPARWVKWVVGTAIVLHAMALFVVVTSASSPQFQAPELLQIANLQVRKYTNPLFLQNPFRFYAPEPGATNVVWIRFRYADGTTRWRELPRRNDFFLRMPFQRQMSLTMLLTMHTIIVPVDPTSPEAGGSDLWNPARVQPQLSPEGHICIGSYVRHMCRDTEWSKAWGTGAAVDRVEMYAVLHNILTPNQIKMNIRPDDPRLYEVYLLGVYFHDGRPESERPTPFQGRVVNDLFAYMMQDDVGPFLERQTGLNINDPAQLEAALEKSGMPLPLRWPIYKDKSLLNINRPRRDIAEDFDRVVRSEDDLAALAKSLGLDSNNLMQGSPSGMSSFQGTPSGAPGGAAGPGRTPSKTGARSQPVP